MFVLYFLPQLETGVFMRRTLSIFLIIDLLNCVKKVIDYMKRFLIWGGYCKLAMMLVHCVIWSSQQSCEMGIVIILFYCWEKLMQSLKGLVRSRTEPGTWYCLIEVHALFHYDSLFLLLSFKNNFLFVFMWIFTR